MKKTAQNIRKFAFIMCIVVLVGMFVYYHFMRREVTKEDNIPKNEVGRLLSRDLEDGYPESAREVMELYVRYVQLMYNNKTSEEELGSLLQQIRKMYHTELLAINPLENQLSALKKETDSFKEKNRKITTCTIDANIQKKKVKDKQCSLLKVAFLVSTSKGYAKTYQSFILSKENERWKIIGFKLIEGENDIKIGGKGA